MTRPSAITFDLYGTLVDVRATVVPALEEFLRARGRTADAARSLLSDWFTRRSQALLVDALLGGPRTPFATLSRRALEGALAELDEGADPPAAETLDALVERWNRPVPFPDLATAVPRLRAAGMRVAILTNADGADLERLAPALGVPFDARLSSEIAGGYKPAPAVFREAARRLDVAPAEVLHVAAAASEIAGARAAGMRTAFVGRGRPAPANAFPDFVARDLSELADRLLR